MKILGNICMGITYVLIYLTSILASISICVIAVLMIADITPMQQAKLNNLIDSIKLYFSKLFSFNKSNLSI